MFEKEIIGIHIADNFLDISVLTKKNDWFISEQRRWDTSGFKSGLEYLENFLNQIRPFQNRLISVSFSQRDIFLRDVSLNNVSIEEAINSVKLGISLYTHLESNEIYHDEYPSEEHKGIKIMLQYAKKSTIDAITDIFKKTKHIKSLFAISSCFLGFDMLIRHYKAIFPAVFLLKQENIQNIVKNKNWLSMHGKDNWLGVHSFNENDIIDNIKAYLPEELLLTSPQNITLTSHFNYSKNQPLKDIVKDIIDAKIPLSQCLCTAALCFDKPKLCFYPKYKKRFFKPEKRLYIIFVCLSAFLMLSLTIYNLYEYTKLRSNFINNQNKLKQIEKNIEPLIQIEKQANELQKNHYDIQEFNNQKVSVLDVLKVLTEITPDNTYLKTFYYSDNKIRISVSGLSAIELMDIWRKNNKFADVKLVSTVNKEKENLENFSVEILLSAIKGTESKIVEAPEIISQPIAPAITPSGVKPVEY